MRDGPLALEGPDGLCLSRRPLGRLVFGCFQLFKLKLHLLQEPCLALRAAAINLATHLLDLELEVTDQCLGRLRRWQPPALALAATASA